MSGNFGCGSTGDAASVVGYGQKNPRHQASTSMKLAWPATASSMALSMTSAKRWCSAFRQVPPIYMPGRRRTGFKPLQHLDRRRVVAGFAHGPVGLASSCGIKRFRGRSPSVAEGPPFRLRAITPGGRSFLLRCCGCAAEKDPPPCCSYPSRSGAFMRASFTGKACPNRAILHRDTRFAPLVARNKPETQICACHSFPR